jgi:hypothetical protein
VERTIARGRDSSLPFVFSGRTNAVSGGADDHEAWAGYSSSRLATPSFLLFLYGGISAWSELALLGQSIRGVAGGIAPLLRQEWLSAFVATGWYLLTSAVHGLGLATAVLAIASAWFLYERRRFGVARAAALGVTVGAVLLPLADIATLSCCALVPATVLGTIGVFGGLLALLTLADDGVRSGFANA